MSTAPRQPQDTDGKPPLLSRPFGLPIVVLIILGAVALGMTIGVYGLVALAWTVH